MSENQTETPPTPGSTENAQATEIPTKNESEVLAAKLAESDQKYKYLYADFENFKKRAIKERQDALKFGFEKAAEELLPVLDNLDRALHFAKPESDPNLISGLKMVLQQFKAALEKQGVTEIPSLDQPFNPELHEAVGQAPSDKPAGTIVQEHQKGYMIHGRLLRASRVMVSTGTAQN